LEESGTTDFGGSLLRYYTSEGVVQGHQVHVLGMNEGWGRDLPGVSDVSVASGKSVSGEVGERMKIAWRYERLGEFGTGTRGKSVEG
jgi:elongator complex protein 4